MENLAGAPWANTLPPKHLPVDAIDAKNSVMGEIKHICEDLGSWQVEFDLCEGQWGG